MNFAFSDEQKMVFDEAKSFSKKYLAPYTKELDENGEYNEKALKKLGELGFLGMTVPEKFGGSGFVAIAYAGAMLEFSKEDAGIAVILSVHNSLVNESILKFGTNYQKKKFSVC